MVVLNGNKNQKVIAYKGDREPVKVFYRPKYALTPVLQENVSYKPKTSDTQGDSITYSSEYKKNLLNLSIKGGTSQSIAPTPESPQAIQNASNISVILSGANLYDISKVTGANFWNTSANPQVAGGTQCGTITDGVLHLKYGVYANNIFWTGAKIPIKQGGYYYVSCDVKIDSSVPTSSTTFRFLNKSKNNERTSLVYLSSVPVRNEWVHLAPEKVSVPDDWVGDDVYLILQSVGIASQYTNLKQYAKNIMITYGEHTDYEPYTEPTTVTTDLTLAENDVLTIDYINKTVGVARNTKVIELTGKEENWQDLSYGGDFAYSLALNLPSWEFPDLEKSYYCTHFKGYTEQSGVPFFEIYKNDGNYLLDFYFVSQTDLAEWQSWLEEQYDNGTPVKVQWSIDEEYSLDTEENVTGVWVNELLNLPTTNGTNVISTDADVPTGNINITYAIWGGADE